MSSSLAWAAPAANTATAPKQVVSRKLRIGILPATMPRVTDARTRAPRVGTRSVGKASGSVSQRNAAQGVGHFWYLRPASLRGYVRTPVTLTFLKPEAATKSIPGTDRPQPKTFNPSFSAQALVAMK